MAIWRERRKKTHDIVCECGHTKYDRHVSLGHAPACDAPKCPCVRFKAVKEARDEGLEYNGKRYKSGSEKRYAIELDQLKAAGEIRSWKYEEEVRLFVNGEHVTTHYPDFKVVMADGSVEWHEVKGWETDMWRFKRDLFLAVNKRKKNFRYKVIKNG